MTYPSDLVRDFLNENFVSLKLDETDLDEEARLFLRRYRLLWTPGFLYLDPSGGELHRSVGFLPPEDFVTELRIALGKLRYLYRDLDAAADQFGVAAGSASDEATAAEALFWRGIAVYKKTGDKRVLEKEWSALGDRYPDSLWWKRADVFKD